MIDITKIRTLGNNVLVKVSKDDISSIQQTKSGISIMARDKIKYDGKEWTARSVEKYRKANHLTWHEMSNMDSMQLVPYEVNARFTHCGGVSEYNAKIGKEGASDFD